MKYLDAAGTEILQGQIVIAATGKYETKIGVTKCLGWSTTYNQYNGVFVATSVSVNKLCGFTVNKTSHSSLPDTEVVKGIIVVPTPSIELLNQWQPIIDRCVGVAWSREAVKPKADGSKIFHLLTSMKSYYGKDVKNGDVRTTQGYLRIAFKKIVTKSFLSGFSPVFDIQTQFLLDNVEINIQDLVLKFNLDPNGLLKRINALKESMKK